MHPSRLPSPDDPPPLILVGSLRGLTRDELAGGVVLGLLFWGGFAYQTFGLAETTPSRSAFITSLSTPLVPLVSFLVHRSVPRAHVMVGILMAGVGMYFLTRPDAAGEGINRGDLLSLGCAVLFAGQIVAAGHFSRRVAPIRLLAVEMATAAALSLLLAPLLETLRSACRPCSGAVPRSSWPPWRCRSSHRDRRNH